MEDKPRCVNYEFCQREVLPWLHAEYCPHMCRKQACVGLGFGFERLEIFDGDSECPVCMDGPGRRLRFPAGCGHSFCIECSRKILLWDEIDYHLSPVPYGCPPCPNGCENPVKGEQCYCIEYESVQEDWRIRDEVNWKLWNDLEHVSINTLDPYIGNKTCPLCRKKYERTLS